MQIARTSARNARAFCGNTGNLRITGDIRLASETGSRRNTEEIANRLEFSPEKRRVLPQALDDDGGDGRIAPVIPFTNPQEESP